MLVASVNHTHSRYNVMKGFKKTIESAGQKSFLHNKIMLKPDVKNLTEKLSEKIKKIKYFLKNC